MISKLLKLLALLLISLATLFLLYPLLHEVGHALATLLMGGRLGDFAMTPLPHIESGLPVHSSPIRIAIIAMAGLLFPVLICAPFLRIRRFGGFVVILILLISVIAGAVELCIAAQYCAGDIVENDDIVLFMQALSPNDGFAFLFAGGLILISVGMIALCDPVEKLEQIAAPRRSRR